MENDEQTFESRIHGMLGAVHVISFGHKKRIEASWHCSYNFSQINKTKLA